MVLSYFTYTFTSFVAGAYFNRWLTVVSFILSLHIGYWVIFGGGACTCGPPVEMVPTNYTECICDCMNCMPYETVPTQLPTCECIAVDPCPTLYWYWLWRTATAILAALAGYVYSLTFSAPPLIDWPVKNRWGYLITMTAVMCLTIGTVCSSYEFFGPRFDLAPLAYILTPIICLFVFFVSYLANKDFKIWQTPTTTKQGKIIPNQFYFDRIGARNFWFYFGVHAMLITLTFCVTNWIGGTKGFGCDEGTFEIWQPFIVGSVLAASILVSVISYFVMKPTEPGLDTPDIQAGGMTFDGPDNTSARYYNMQQQQNANTYASQIPASDDKYV